MALVRYSARVAGSSGFRSPEHYDRHVGRYSVKLAVLFAERAGVRPGQRVLEVGCGPGALTSHLVSLVGAQSVSAVDPSEPFLDACRERLPGIDAQLGQGESLPFADDTFDVTLAQLVVNFMSEPLVGVSEMRRVTRRGGRVAACVWDYGGGAELLRAFWDAAKASASAGNAPPDEATMANCDPVSMQALWRRAGLEDVDVEPLMVSADYSGFDDLWAPIAGGAGPSGAYAQSLGSAAREALRSALFERLGSPERPFRLKALAWCATGSVSRRLPLDVAPA